MAKELYVGSISPKATEEDIRKLFSVVGTVTSIHLITDPVTGEFRECGYVRMSSLEETKDAVETLDGALLVNRVITVSIARPQQQNTRKFGPGRGKFGGPGGKSGAYAGKSGSAGGKSGGYAGKAGGEGGKFGGARGKSGQDSRPGKKGK